MHDLGRWLNALLIEGYVITVEAVQRRGIYLYYPLT